MLTSLAINLRIMNNEEIDTQKNNMPAQQPHDYHEFIKVLPMNFIRVYPPPMNLVYFQQFCMGKYPKIIITMNNGMAGLFYELAGKIGVDVCRIMACNDISVSFFVRLMIVTCLLPCNCVHGKLT